MNIKKNEMVLAIIDGGNKFSPDSCKFVTECEAISKGYPYVRGNSPREYWENMMKGKAIVWK